MAVSFSISTESVREQIRSMSEVSTHIEMSHKVLLREMALIDKYWKGNSAEISAELFQCIDEPLENNIKQLQGYPGMILKVMIQCEERERESTRKISGALNGSVIK